MSETKKNILQGVALFSVLGLLLLAAPVIGRVVGSMPGDTSNVEATPAPKPLTKTRCDWTGLASASIIEEERKNGYQFNGRISTLFCSDNHALSFSILEGATQ